MTHTKTLLSVAFAALTGFAQTTQAANVDWSISVGVPVQVSVPAPIAVAAPAPAYTQPALPNIEQTQAAQQARIQWGAQVGLITGHEYYRLQQTQQYIEQQRQWAYADGWLTYDEHLNLTNMLNGAGQQIERSLVNWQRVNTVYYPMPPVLTFWNEPRPYYGHRHQRPPVAAPIQPVVQPAVQPQPRHPHHPQPMVIPAQPGAQPAVQPTVPPVVQPQPPAQPRPQHSRMSDLLNDVRGVR